MKDAAVKRARAVHFNTSPRNGHGFDVSDTSWDEAGGSGTACNIRLAHSSRVWRLFQWVRFHNEVARNSAAYPRRPRIGRSARATVNWRTTAPLARTSKRSRPKKR